MSLPTKSELYGNSNKKNEDFITLNIYNNGKLNDEETKSEIDQTQGNLQLVDNSIEKPKEYLDNLKKKAMFLDNRRNQYPLSEYREAQAPAPPIYNENSTNNNRKPNNYSKSVNPNINNNYQVTIYNQINNNNKVYNLNPLSTEERLEQNTNNVVPVVNKNKKKNENKWSSKEICCCIFLFWIFPLIGLIYCLIIMSQKKKNNN